MINGEGNEPVNNEGQPQGEVADVQIKEGSQETVVPVEPSFDERVLQWAAEKGRQITSVDELFTPIEKEVVKEVNPWEDVMDEQDRAILTYKKETGRSREEFLALQKNWDEADVIQLARERVKLDAPGLNLSTEKIDEYIEEELGIDLNDLDSAKTLIKLNAFTNDLRKAKKEEQEKYKVPVEKKPQQEAPAYNPENYVTMPDGSVMTKALFEDRTNKINDHIGKLKTATSEFKAQTFTVEIDDKGEKKELSYTYDFPQEDSDGMSAWAEDLLSGKLADKYRTDEGFDHKGFVKELIVNPVMGKIIPTLLQRARAEAIEEVLLQQGNHNFDSNLPVHSQQREGVKIVSAEEYFRSRKQ